MNSIYFSEEHTILRNQIRRFVEQKVVPVADEWEEKGYIPREILQQMGDLGFLGIRYSTDYGGSEMDALGSVILAEELGRSTFGGLAVTVLVHTDMASPHLDNFGNKQQLNKYMSEIISGQKITGVAVTEPDVGSDVAAMKTRAVKDGNDYVINGSKMFITNGVQGDLFFVAAKTDLDAKPSRGITIFAVEKGTPGFSVGKNLKKMGWLSSDTAELIFDNCRVPADNIIGELNKGFYSIMRNFQNERLVLGAQSMGEASKAIELTMDYVTTRKAFSGVLFDKQAIRQRLASLATRVEAGKQLVYHSAWLDAQGLDCIKEVSMVKAYCGELVNEVMYDCLQFHGGFGYVRESAIERMYRDARIQAIAGGATEVMLEEVSKRMIN
ncbi:MULTISPECIES: acyl-CoA dehydrogenase family protein [Cycloclasticus]|uniref:acyl-CoA dehydrogenase family protein n=1 Tax=Cycloclasticus TaxID=34067 RepID=UPI000286A95F|nr:MULTISPECIES: acyl-CoA dehydrogenase family protein [Cycloclasticus]AFT67266.1 Acyl-CoA dehydrogenase domain protein [Cycloclasticus sp. P1]SHJ46009.1 acyl-CoA dehydrogenase [Cycloclasticus pugetii]